MNPDLLRALTASATFFAAYTAIGIVAMLVMDRLSRHYRLWKSVHEGNVAVALAGAGRILGLALIGMYSIAHNDTLTQGLMWVAIGMVYQTIAYLLFELLTPKLDVGKELAAGNTAVGVMSLAMSIGISLIVCASIS